MATTKKTFHVYENRKLNCILACVCLAIGIVSAIVFKGFNLGIDFEPGLGLRVQVAVWPWPMTAARLPVCLS